MRAYNLVSSSDSRYIRKSLTVRSNSPGALLRLRTAVSRTSNDCLLVLRSFSAEMMEVWPGRLIDGKGMMSTKYEYSG